MSSSFTSINMTHNPPGRIPFCARHEEMEKTSVFMSTTNERNAEESEGVLGLFYSRSRWKTNMFSPRSCIVPPHKSSRAFRRRCSIESKWKEMEGRGLNVAQTGSRLCVASRSASHTKGLFQNFAVVKVIFSAYLTQCALPAVYITGTAETY